MKINLLYILIPAALFGCYWIAKDLQSQSTVSFFGTAETEPQTLNFEHAVLVQDIRVVSGNQVKKGDTLAIFYRSELDKTTVEKLADINQLEVEKNAKNETLNKDKDVLLARQTARIAELKAEIRVLQTEDSLQLALKKNIYNTENANRISSKSEQIKVLQESILQLEKQTQEQIAQINSQRQANQVIAQAKLNQVQKDIDFVKLERNKLFLIAPMDGYVEQVNMGKNMLIPQYKDMIKINPKKPNKIIGFIHESTEVPFQLGDSVGISSASRPAILTKGTIVGSSPKLVELPLRLRKFVEVKAWGREIFIQMPDTNKFYIGEKIVISLSNRPPQ